eukprot:5852802-Amphidinium_carterae.1
MEATVEDGGLLPLTKRNINMMEAIEHDTPEDRLRLQQMQDIDDDLQSITDEQTAERERWEQENLDGQELFARDQMRTIHDQWNEEGRLAEAEIRQGRRQEQTRPRHEGSEQALRERLQ